MKVAKKQVKRWTISQGDLTIDVTFEDYRKGVCQIDILIGDNNLGWSHFWNSTGCDNSIEFLKDASEIYLVDKFMYQRKEEEIDTDKLCELAHEKGITYDIYAFNGYDEEGIYKIFGEDFDPYYDLPMKKTRELILCEKAVKLLKDAVKENE